MLSEPPLVGRDEELGCLDELLQKAISGSGGFVLLAGEAGIGKTRLATEFEKKARSSGCRVLVGNCLPSTQIPYLVFLEALNHLFEEKEKPSRSQKLTRAARKAAPDLMKAIPVIGGTMKASTKLYEEYREGKNVEVSKEHVLFKTLDILKTESTKTPLILHLDDLQWADSMSIAMLHFLARNCRDLRVMLLGTYRSEEVLNQEAGIHPLLDSIRVMKRENIVQELNLRPLGEKELNLVVSSMLEMPVHDAVLSHIFKESGGSPLFAVETIRLLVSSDAFTIKDGKFTITGQMSGVIPSSVKEVIIRRIERVPKEERKALDFASVIGMTFSPELLAEALKKDYLELLEELERLSDQHQLIREVDNGYAFTHEKVRKFTYDSLSTIRRKEMHRTVGLIIERSAAPYSDVYGTLATHFIGAGDDLRLVIYSILAARSNYKRGAAIEAAQYFNQALERICENTEAIHFRLTALREFAEVKAEWVIGDWKGALDLYEECLRIGVKEEIKGQILLGMAECWEDEMLGEGSNAKAWELIEEAKLLPWNNEVQHAKLNGVESYLNFCKGDFEIAEILAERAENVFEKYAEWRYLIITMIIHINACLGLGKVDEAIDLGRKAERSSQQHETVLAHELHFLGIAYLHKGEYELALDCFTRDFAQSEKLGDAIYATNSLLWQACVWDAWGDYERSKECAMKANDLASCSPTGNKVYGIAYAIHYLIRMRRVQEAREHYAKLAEIAKNCGMDTYCRAKIELVEAELELLSGMKDNADLKFLSSLKSKKGGYHILGLAETNQQYGEVLLQTGYIEDGKMRLREAIKHYSRLSNDYQVRRLTAVIENYS